VLEDLRRRPSGAKVPVLVVTSDPDAERLVHEAEQRAGVAGPTRVLTKPFTQVELIAAARAVTSSGAPG
jgi:CheY-like chemotaxis protein